MFKTTIKTWILVIFLLITLDISLRFILPLSINTEDLRPVKKDTNFIEVIAPRIKKDQGNKVVFIGDSQMYGSGVINEKDTIPGHYRSLLKNEKSHVYNLGGKGYGPGEIYYQLNYLKGQKIDLIIYNVSLGWLNRTKFTELIGIGVLNGLKPLEPNDVQRTPMEYISNTSEYFWYLRGHKNYLRYLIGQSFGEKVPSDLALAKREPGGWNNDNLRKLIGQPFGEIPINKENLLMLDKTLSQLDSFSQNGTRVVVYISPQNRTIFERINMWNNAGVQKNVDQVKSIVAKHGFEVYNFVDSIPGDYFEDSIHMDTRGNKMMATTLYDLTNTKGGKK